MVRIDPDGIRLGGVFLLLCACSGLGFLFFGNVAFAWMAGTFAGIWLYVLFFFRDPNRAAPDKQGVLSAADGVVLDTAQIPADGFEGGNALRISVFMSVFNVHVNRSPVDGRVVRTMHRPGKKISAMNRRAEYENECGDTDIETLSGLVRVRQIAGLIARRVVTRVHQGDDLRRGQRIGLIRFGSRVDVFLPVTYVPVVRKGDRVRAGATIIAKQTGT